MILDISPEDGVKLLQKIEKIARISHRSEEKQTTDSWKSFIPFVVCQKGDYSIIEHASVTATFRVPRGISHEIVRHRLFSYTQESTRFVNYTKEKTPNIEVPIPSDLKPENLQIWQDTVAMCKHTYEILIRNGERPQTARSILPTDTIATIAMTGNLRAWRWFLLARTTRESHTDMRNIAILLLEEFKHCIPILYEDIEPNARQIDNAQKAH